MVFSSSLLVASRSGMGNLLRVRAKISQVSDTNFFHVPTIFFRTYLVSLKNFLNEKIINYLSAVKHSIKKTEKKII